MGGVNAAKENTQYVSKQVKVSPACIDCKKKDGFSFLF